MTVLRLTCKVFVEGSLQIEVNDMRKEIKTQTEYGTAVVKKSK